MKQSASCCVRRRTNRMREPGLRSVRQRGVAVVTALLLTTLAMTVVANLFWQQQVQVRFIENQRLQLQKQWMLRGALDWAELILHEDARYSKADTLDEPWAVPLTATRLDQFVENGKADTDASGATLSGNIVDAQSRYNLSNLSVGGSINRKEVAVFERLLGNLQVSPALAMATAEAMAASQRKPAVGAAAGGVPHPMPLGQIDDLLVVPGFTPDMIIKLREFVVFLPRVTPVNANTASAEVLAARIDTLSVADAYVLLTARKTASFRDLADISQRLPGRAAKLSSGELAVASEYFLVHSKVRMNRSALEVQALIERNGASTKLVWIREQ
ncbi:type II secretion system minor pseudopilin GspK [Noviherbaspirillum saxi]|nr:type II secretion system minor pseudopilin GspK [Noviherbaspirillum saxi]